MLVRQIEEKDYEKFEELFCAYYEELDCEDDPCHLFDEYVLPDLKDNLFSVAVAVDGETLFGFIIYQTDAPENEWCFRQGDGDIREIYVTPSHRKRGIGGKLLTFAENELAKSGVKATYTLPTEEAESFFTHCGYSDNGEYCAELDNKVFEKTLNF
ncbi:MAG: GNAT family N-acetyltransferase [Candidatus Coproplasma sp.]